MSGLFNWWRKADYSEKNQQPGVSQVTDKGWDLRETPVSACLKPTGSIALSTGVISS
jgi:hypothetical protein